MNDLIVTSTPTRVAMLLDETSSMLSLKSTTLSALSEYITELKQGTEQIIFSLVAFSSIRTHTLVKSQPIKAVDIDVIREEYKPAGSTPLIDAAMKLILATEKIVQPGEKVIIALQTDGEENCSVEFKLADLQAKIKAKSDEGWQFVFMGAGLDAYQAAAQYGISAGSTVSYGKDAASTQNVFRSMASNTRSYSAGQSTDMNWSAQQKADAGDQYWKPTGAPDPQPSEAPKTKSTVDDIDI